MHVQLHRICRWTGPRLISHSLPQPGRSVSTRQPAGAALSYLPSGLQFLRAICAGLYESIPCVDSSSTDSVQQLASHLVQGCMRALPASADSVQALLIIITQVRVAILQACIVAFSSKVLCRAVREHPLRGPCQCRLRAGCAAGRVGVSVHLTRHPDTTSCRQEQCLFQAQRALSRLGSQRASFSSSVYRLRRVRCK